MYKRELVHYHWECKSVLSLLGFPSVSVIKTLLPIQKMQVQSLGHENALEKKMATHSSSLVWEISWTEEPGGYSPWGRKESDTTERLTLLTLLKCLRDPKLASESVTKQTESVWTTLESGRQILSPSCSNW